MCRFFLLGIGYGLAGLCLAQPKPGSRSFYGLRPEAFGVVAIKPGNPVPSRQPLVDTVTERNPPDPSRAFSGLAAPFGLVAVLDSTYWVSRIAALPHRDVLLLFPYLLQRATAVAFHIPMMPPTLAAQPHQFSSQFGWRHHPVLGGVRWHAGIDIAGPPQPVKATAFGRVAVVSYEAGYGLHIRINHGNSYETLYGHLSLAHVKEGQWVRPGELIGISGRSGRVTGYHLHYEVRKGGQAIDPSGYMTAAIRFIDAYRAAASARPTGLLASD